jgi:hypothetical protein
VLSLPTFQVPPLSPSFFPVICPLRHLVVVLKGGEGKGREGGKGRDGKRREGKGREGEGIPCCTCGFVRPPIPPDLFCPSFQLPTFE